MTSIFLHHLKLDGKAREIVEERIEAIAVKDQIREKKR